MKTDNLPSPPSTLARAGKAFWRKIVAEFAFEPQHLEILVQACRCLDRIEVCRVDVRKTGLTVLDRFGQSRPNPSAELEIKYFRTFKAHLRELQLDIEPADSGYSRPPRLSLHGRMKHA